MTFNRYEDMLAHVHSVGIPKSDRTNTGTNSIFGMHFQHDLRNGTSFPLITSKHIHWKSVAEELFWMLSGSTNVKDLQAKGVTIWDEWRQPWPEDRSLVKVTPIIKNFVGYKGDFSFAGVNAAHDSIEGKLASSWVHMMRRCYDSNSHNYKFYGAKGVSVSLAWHDVKNYIEDVQSIPHWEYKKRHWNDFELDKDHWGANQYSKDTCIWLPKSENVPNKPFGIIFPDGREEWFLNFTDASKKTNLSRSSLHRFLSEGLPEILKGKNKTASGWVFKTETEDDSLIRKSLVDVGELGPIYGAQWRNFNGIDQISSVVESITKDPFGRRHIVTAWNPIEINNMALPPCHMMFQFNIVKPYGAHVGTLELAVYQRSADMFLGVPFNIASYGLLLMLMAHHCGLNAGNLNWFGGDCHIYSNHYDQVEEQLRRPDDRDLPVLFINAEHASIFDYKFEDLQLTGYDPYPTIKAPVAV